jgi:hypothetical protein
MISDDLLLYVCFAVFYLFIFAQICVRMALWYGTAKFRLSLDEGSDAGQRL